MVFGCLAAIQHRSSIGKELWFQWPRESRKSKKGAQSQEQRKPPNCHIESIARSAQISARPLISFFISSAPSTYFRKKATGRSRTTQVYPLPGLLLLPASPATSKHDNGKSILASKLSPSGDFADADLFRYSGG